jgi:hypothetical protein
MIFIVLNIYAGMVSNQIESKVVKGWVILINCQFYKYKCAKKNIYSKKILRIKKYLLKMSQRRVIYFWIAFPQPSSSV